MQPNEFIELAVGIYGRSGWQKQLANDVGISRSQISRYANGHFPVPQVLQVLLRAMQKEAA